MATRWRAIGFDLGETLLTYSGVPLNWGEHYGVALRGVGDACGFLVDERKILGAEAVLRAFNTRLHPRINEITAEHVFSRILLTWGMDPEPSVIDAAVNAFFDYFRQHLTAYEDSLSALLALRASGLKLGALTDVPYGMPRKFVEADLAEAGLSEHLDVVLSSVDVGFRKPDPRGFSQLAQSLGVKVSEMLYVGNEPKDIRGAIGAGMTAVFIDREGENLAPPGTHHEIESLSELVALVRHE
jgi:putative hydrolase of the HAD superfamily